MATQSGCAGVYPMLLAFFDDSDRIADAICRQVATAACRVGLEMIERQRAGTVGFIPGFEVIDHLARAHG